MAFRGNLGLLSTSSAQKETWQIIFFVFLPEVAGGLASARKGSEQLEL